MYDLNDHKKGACNKNDCPWCRINTVTSDAWDVVRIHRTIKDSRDIERLEVAMKRLKDTLSDRTPGEVY